MPLYEYECTECSHRLEVLQKISDDKLVYCPKCNEASLKKLISAAGFRLKGTGWYETDFKNNTSKDASSDTKSAASTSKTESTSSTPSKTDSANSKSASA